MFTRFFSFKFCLVFLGFVYCASAISFVSRENLDKSLQVSTANGIVQGRVSRTFKGRRFYSFKGIPYGRPPTGDLRFRAPKPAQTWQHVLDATKEGPTCLETFLRNSGVFFTGSEDCLILNVFTPMDPEYPIDSLPVLVWFHGGAFIEGNSTAIEFGPEFLLDEDVVVVSMNYRVGIFGFLSTEDSASPGNYGLKDQLLALQWVRRNIKNFGGNPNQVTISGQSAGAASVLYHMASPKSKGLFHRAISISGSSLCAFARKRNSREIAFKVGTAFGINTASSKELVSKLRMVNLESLKRVSRTLALLGVVTLVQEGFPFGPVIEQNHKDAFISDSTYALFERGKYNRVPLLLGTTSTEALFFEKLVKNIKPLTLLFDLSPGSLPNPSMNIDSFEKRREAGNEIKRHYFKRGVAFEATDEEIEDLMSDDQFLRPIRKTAQFISQYNPVYFYIFSYNSNYGIKGFDDELRGVTRGVVHVEDITYIWKHRIRSFPTNFEDAMMVSKMVKLWTNFARTGNPTPEKDYLLDGVIWPSVQSPSNIKYLDIDATLTIRSNFRGEHMLFWDQLYDKYGGKSYITY